MGAASASTRLCWKKRSPASALNNPFWIGAKRHLPRRAIWSGLGREDINDRGLPNMKLRYSLISSVFTTFALFSIPLFAEAPRWSEQKATEWYAQQPWLVGSNYIPKSAINELEMWQESTFDPAQIDKELGWAEAMGMNTMRVFLHDLLWQQNAQGFRKRIDQFLVIASRHHIRPLFVLFDSCWDPLPKLGPQHAPVPGVHNSGWVQSPGAKALDDPGQYP